ncbi:MAG: MFS transporter [Buchnera aphidicola (Periphyllus acericola)]|uniref:MFS transporter n=1 Tax=Buchnera aphidicola TaxID=9 RepID=UPI0030CEDA13|nr:MFS transporter [Buchnera aphidicola (Periphyllus acericola)]
MLIKKKNNQTKNLFQNNYIKYRTKDFYKMIISLFFVGFSTFSILYSIQPILPIFSKKFFLTPSESSLALSISTVSMAFGILFISPLSNLLGRKKVIFLSLFIAAILTIFCSFAQTWLEVIIIRSLIGFSLSGVTSISILYLSEEVDINFLSLCIGLYISGNTIGGFFGRLISNIIVHFFSWRMVFLIIGSLSLFFSILSLINLPSSQHFKKSNLKIKFLFKRFLLPFKIKTCLILFLFGFLFMGSFVSLFNYIGYRLIMKPFLLNPIFISFLSIIYLIGVYSSPKASFLSRKYGKKKILTYSLYIMLLGVLLTYFNNLLIIIFGLFFFTTGFFLAHSTASSWISILTKCYKLEISSLYFFFYYIGSSLFGSFIGIFWFFWGWNGVFFILNFVLFCSLILVKKLSNKIKII